MSDTDTQYLLAQVFAVGNAILDRFYATDWPRVILWIKVFSFLLSAALLFLIGLALKRHRDVMVAAWHASRGETPGMGETAMDPEERRSEHDEWVHTRKLFASRQEDDKRLAIIDADALLDNALRKMQIPGETMAERLASPEMPQLSNLNEIAFSHKFRNELVHEPGTKLDPLDAERAMKAYEHALKELKII